MQVTIQDLYLDAISFKGLFYETVVNAVPKDKQGKLCGSYLTSKIDFTSLINPFAVYAEQVQKFMQDNASFAQKTPPDCLTFEQVEKLAKLFLLSNEVKNTLKQQSQNEGSFLTAMFIAFEASRADVTHPEVQKIQEVARKFFVQFTALYLACLAKKELWIRKSASEMFDNYQILYNVLLNELSIK